jgi:hypothetical protein
MISWAPWAKSPDHTAINIMIGVWCKDFFLGGLSPLDQGIDKLSRGSTAIKHIAEDCLGHFQSR